MKFFGIYTSYVTLALALTLGFPACKLQSCQKKQTAEEKPLYIALVNQEPISLSSYVVSYNRAVQELDTFAKSDSATVAQLKERTLNKLIFQKLIEQEAKRQNIVVTDEELDREVNRFKEGISEEQFAKNLLDQLLTFEEWKELYREKMLAEKVARVSVSVNRTFSDEELGKFYNEHKKEYATEKTVRASQIYVRDESLAEDLLKRVLKGESFDQLAKQHSLSPDATAGGDLGFFARDEKIPEFNLAFDLRPGQVHPSVVKSSYGYHIIKTLAVQQARQMAFPEVREMIRRKLLEDREESSYKTWIDELSKKADIKKNTMLLTEFDKS